MNYIYALTIDYFYYMSTKWPLLFLLLVVVCLLPAQNIFFSSPEDEGKELVYETEKYGSFIWHTNGLKFAYTSGDIITFNKTKYYTVSFTTVHHRKEQRQNRGFYGNVGSIFDTPRPFRFGKINHFYVLSGGLGSKRYISEKAQLRNVRIAANYNYGVNIGVLRPYYLWINLEDIGNGRVETEMKYTGDNDDYFLTVERIIGGTGFSYGWNELKIRPGLNLTGSMIFEFGQHDKRINALEVGLMLDVYAKRVPIMATEENSAFFINFFASYSFGLRN